MTSLELLYFGDRAFHWHLKADACVCIYSEYREQGFKIHLEKCRQMWTSVRGATPSPTLPDKAGESTTIPEVRTLCRGREREREREHSVPGCISLSTCGGVRCRWGHRDTQDGLLQRGDQAGAGGQRCVRGSERHPERVLAGRQLQPEPAARFPHTHTRPLARAHGAAQKPGGGEAGRGVT